MKVIHIATENVRLWFLQFKNSFTLSKKKKKRITDVGHIYLQWALKCWLMNQEAGIVPAALATNFSQDSREKAYYGDLCLKHLIETQAELKLKSGVFGGLVWLRVELHALQMQNKMDVSWKLLLCQIRNLDLEMQFYFCHQTLLVWWHTLYNTW